MRLGVVEVALLRHLGRESEARERLAQWLKLDPSNSALRFEGTLLGGTDAALWAHLASDPDRIIEVASEYMRLGMFDTAAKLLAHDYPAVDASTTEPGTVLPQQHPLIAYYRAYCDQRLGRPAIDEYKAAAQLSTRYIFPSRADTILVLRAAVAANPEDASAHFLSGSLWMSGGMTDRALAEWEKARQLQPAIPTLHRNIGYSLLFLKNDPKQAAEVLREGLTVDPSNVALYSGLDQALTLLGRPPSDRAAVFSQFPDPKSMPSALVYTQAIALAEAGRAEEARKLFYNRFFQSEEGGTPVAQVWLEVELMRVRGLIHAGKTAKAREAIQMIGREVPGLAFTRDGLAQILAMPRYEYEVGEVFAELGDTGEAGAHWQKAVDRRSDGLGPQAVFSLLAAKRLNPTAEDWHARVDAALSRSEALVQTTGWTGLAQYSRGVLLRELGRTDDAQAAFRSAVLARDRGLSQYLGRTGLAERQ